MMPRALRLAPVLALAAVLAACGSTPRTEYFLLSAEAPPAAARAQSELAAVLVRGSEKGRQYSLRLKDLLKRGDISANAPVLPGDIIIVPQSWF